MIEYGYLIMGELPNRCANITVAMLDESLHFSDDSLNYSKVGKDGRRFRAEN